MKRALAIGGMLFLLSGCAIINSLYQPTGYVRSKPFSIMLQATNTMEDGEYIPAVHVLMPEQWKLLYCKATGLGDLGPSTDPLDLSNDPNVIEGLIKADYEPPYREGYEWRDFQFDSVGMTEGQNFTIQCKIEATTCGKYELMYGITTFPAGLFGSDLAEAEDAYSEFLQDFFVSREIICEEPIPTVNEWG
ncbi:MAG: hypothetical protein JRK53_19910, partial [Deltaproteobacteria bacterium]|nr:hypothetical protein [Deltaproteobacteria bacterium]